GPQPRGGDRHERADRGDVPGGVAVAARSHRIEHDRDERRQGDRDTERERREPHRHPGLAGGPQHGSRDDRVEQHPSDDGARLTRVWEGERVGREHQVIAGEHPREGDDEGPGHADRHDVTSVAVGPFDTFGAGQCNATTVPSPSAVSMTAAPPTLATRSRIDTRTPSRSVGTASGSKPQPSSPTSTTMSSPPPRTTAQRRAGPACCRLFTIACTAAE